MATEMLLPAEATHLLAPIPVQIPRSKLNHVQVWGWGR